MIGSTQKLKMVLPGGSGQVGTMLAREFHRQGHEAVVLSRRPQSFPWRTVGWDGQTMGSWAEELDGASVVINLAGRSVDCRYSARNRREILDSRVISTKLVGEAIARAIHPPPIWLQASTATNYAHRFDAPNDEDGILGGNEAGAPSSWRFSIEVAAAWERALDQAKTPHTRKVKLRSAMTMSTDRGGVFAVLLGLVRRGLGGTAGTGRQYVSWIHERDFLHAVSWLIEHDQLEGAVNLSAPQPLPNAEFMRTLRQAWGISMGLPAPRWLLEIGAFFLRTETELILKSRRVIPGRLLQAGFAFDFPSWPDAAADLCRRWREANDHKAQPGALF